MRHQAAIGHALHVRGKARDVMRAADDDGAACRRSCAIAAAASSARSVSQGPGSRPPSHACAAGRELTRAARPTFAIEPFSISPRYGGEQREAVRGVAEQVAVDEDRRDVARDVVAHAGAREQSWTR